MRQRKPWIVEHSQAAIGRVWTDDDHEHLVSTMRKIDQTVQALTRGKLPAAERHLGVSEADLVGRKG